MEAENSKSEEDVKAASLERQFPHWIESFYQVDHLILESISISLMKMKETPLSASELQNCFTLFHSMNQTLEQFIKLLKTTRLKVEYVQEIAEKRGLKIKDRSSIETIVNHQARHQQAAKNMMVFKNDFFKKIRLFFFTQKSSRSLYSQWKEADRDCNRLTEELLGLLAEKRNAINQLLSLHSAGQGHTGERRIQIGIKQMKTDAAVPASPKIFHKQFKKDRRT